MKLLIKRLLKFKNKKPIQAINHELVFERSIGLSLVKTK